MKKIKYFLFGIIFFFILCLILILTNNVVASHIKNYFLPVAYYTLSKVGIKKQTIKSFFRKKDLNIKKMIEEDCHIDLKNDSEEKIALALMDFVFKTTVRGPESPIEPSQRYFLAHSTPPLQQVCSGYMTELRYLLDQVDIESREYALAALSAFNKDAGDTHAVLEAFINNKWVFLDPTFNCYWNCSDGKKMLSLQEIHSCIKLGNILVVQEGVTKIPRYSIKEYYMDFKDFIYAYKAVGPDGNFGDWTLFK